MLSSVLVPLAVLLIAGVGAFWYIWRTSPPQKPKDADNRASD